MKINITFTDEIDFNELRKADFATVSREFIRRSRIIEALKKLFIELNEASEKTRE